MAIAGLLTLRAAVRLARSAHPAHVELVERALAGDVALADASDEGPEGDARIAATELVLAASESGHREHFDALLGLVERGSATPAPALVFEFVERCLTGPGPVAHRARALAVIRSLPPAATSGGPRRYALLGELGALRDRDDLERCLSDCRNGPSLARDSERLLTVALAIPPMQPDEARRLDPDTVARLEQLREDAKRWYRMDSHEAEQWLSEQLRTRPLELPALAPWPWPRYAGEPERARSRSRGELDSALALLEDPSRDRAARERTAEWILATPETRTIADSWARVLAASPTRSI